MPDQLDTKVPELLEPINNILHCFDEIDFRTTQDYLTKLVALASNTDEYSERNLEVDNLFVECSHRICDLAFVRIFDRNYKEGPFLIDLQEVDYLHNDFIKLSELCMIIPRLGFACLAPIGILNGVIEHSRFKRAELCRSEKSCTTAAKIALLDTVRFRAFKHEPCCRSLIDAIFQQVSFKSATDDDLEWVLEFLKRENFCFATFNNSCWAFSSQDLLSDPTLLKNMLEYSVNFMPELARHCFFSFINAPHAAKHLIAMGCSLKKLPKHHPVSSLENYSELKTRIVLFAHCTPTINYYVEYFRVGKRIFIDSSFNGLVPLGVTHGAGHYRKLIEERLLTLCDELMSIVALTVEEDYETEQMDFLVATVLDFSEWTITRALYWPEEFVTLIKRHAHLWVFWIQKHADNYINRRKRAWTLSWAARATESIIFILNCSLIPFDVFSREQVNALVHSLEVFLSEPPDDETISELYNQTTDHLEEIFRITSGASRSVTSFERYQFLSHLCSRGTGKVFKCFDVMTRSIVAIKVIEGLDPVIREKAKQECKFLMTLRHMNIVRYVDYYVDNDNWHLVMEYCEGTNLSLLRKIYQASKDDDLWLRKIGRQILIGLAYLHAQNIVHRDLKPGNIFFTDFGKIKIGDFGEARFIGDLKKAAATPEWLKGTIIYMAPEYFREQPITAKADIWSFGCILWYLASDEVPWTGIDDPMEVVILLREDSEQKPFDASKLAPYGESFQEIINKCLDPDPHSRPSAVELLGMDFFTGVSDILV